MKECGGILEGDLEEGFGGFGYRDVKVDGGEVISYFSYEEQKDLFQNWYL